MGILCPDACQPQLTLAVLLLQSTATALASFYSQAGWRHRGKHCNKSQESAFRAPSNYQPPSDTSCVTLGELRSLLGSQSFCKMRGLDTSDTLGGSFWNSGIPQQSSYHCCCQGAAWPAGLPSCSTHLPTDLDLDRDAPCQEGALSFAHTVPKTSSFPEG